jgi:leader peptidase (prepilin peptidase)/N-methyltransferase
MTACGILAIWAFHVVIGTNAFLLSLCLAWGLLVLAIVDWMDFRLPDMLTLPLIVAGLAAAAVLPAEDVFDTVSAEAIGQLVGSDVSGARWLTAVHVLDHAIAAVIGYAALWIVAWTYRRLRRQEGLGLGDAKLAAAAGAWLGFAPLPSVLLLASISGIVWIAIGAVFHGRAELSKRIPFGVPLSVALWIVWLYEPLAFAGLS